jgi:hypothetical protein
MEKPGKVGKKRTRSAEFLLANAVDERGYEGAKTEVARARAASGLKEADATRLAIRETRDRLQK